MIDRDYRETLLGELRLFECYGIDRELPPALDWTPRRAVLDRIVATGLQMVRRASATWTIQMTWRRMQNDMLKAFQTTPREWEIFNVTEAS